MAMGYDSFVWEWAERRGLEHCQLWTSPDGAKAQGLVVVDWKDRVIRLRYSISFLSDWHLRLCHVFSLANNSQRSISLSRDRGSHWIVDGTPRVDLESCVAVDILDTPFPKTMIVRSLRLEEGRSTTVKVAYIDNRRLLIRPIEQEWERLPTLRQNWRRYRCTTMETAMELEVDEQSIVVLCLHQWRLMKGPEFFSNEGEVSDEERGK